MNNSVFLIPAFAVSALLTGCLFDHSTEPNGNDRPMYELKDGKFTDPRDGNQYLVTKIGSYYWMAENLRYADSVRSPNLKGNSWCYDNDSKNCEKYGRLYTWSAAMDVEKASNGTYINTTAITSDICPAGWNIPSYDIWKDLEEKASRIGKSGAILKSIDGWDESDSVQISTNGLGFYGNPAGRRNSEDGEFFRKGKYGFFWSSSQVGADLASGWTLRFDNDYLDHGEYYKEHAMSVRCVSTSWSVKGELDSSFIAEIPHQYGSLEYKGQVYKTIELGGYIWMAENMNAKVDGSYCYKDDSKNCQKYGRLYTYEAASNVCPEGWELPSSEAVSGLGAISVTSTYKSYDARTLKSTSGWKNDNNGIDMFGFNAYPAGGYESGDYIDLSTSAYFWLQPLDNSKLVLWLRYTSDVFETVPREADNAYSVRCVKSK